MTFKKFKPEYRHTLHGSERAPCDKRGDFPCMVCEGGLGWCVVCGGAEASMPANCPGRMMSPELQEYVQRGTLDFICGDWILVEPKAEQKPPPLPHAQEKRLLEILRDATAYGRLTDWEQKFCDDLLRRVTTYSIWTEISPRQWEVIERIERKLYGL